MRGYMLHNHDFHNAAYATDPLTFDIRCGMPVMAPLIGGRLEELGLRQAAPPALLLVFDLPCGFAVRVLERPEHPQARTIVVTENPCPEYWEDLWDLEPAGLVAGIRVDTQLADAMARVARGERVRLTPPAATSLTPRERAMLHYVAYGWENQRIAQQLHVEEKTVLNTLVRVYAKLGVANRVEAALYYWGRGEFVS